MPLPKSLLKEVVKNLPEEWKVKRESIPAYLQKRGIKEEELKSSGIYDAIKASNAKTFTKEDLVNLELNRKDTHDLNYLTGPNEPYNHIVLPGSKMDNYSVNLRSFNFNPERNASTHFNDLGYEDVLWHTRTTNETLEGIPTRMIQELQSDLHQQGRQLGYTFEEAENKRLAIVKNISEENLGLHDEAVNLYNKLAKRQDTEFQKQKLLGTKDPELTSPFPPSPYAKTWLRKAMEQEVLDALESGQKAIAIPLEGAQHALSRGKGVQKWYETQVRSTMQKLAKTVGGTYKEVQTNPGLKVPTNTADAIKILRDHPEVNDLMKEVAKPGETTTDVLMRAKQNDLAEMFPQLFAKGIEKPKTLEEAQLIIDREDSESLFETLIDLLPEHAKVDPHDVDLQQALIDNWDELDKDYGFSSNIFSYTIGQIVLPEGKDITKQLKLYSAGGIAAGLNDRPVSTEDDDINLFFKSRGYK